MLRFENVTEKHKDGVLNLWNNHSEWGPVTWEQINAWKVSPYEEVIHGVAIDENEVVIGQITFTFCRVRYNEELIKAGRILAPVVNREAIESISIMKPNHPIQQLYNWVIMEAAKQSVEIVYMYPNIRWRPILSSVARNFGLPELVDAAYDFYTIDCDVSQFKSEKFSVKVAEAYSENHYQLWRTTLTNHNNKLAIDRDPDYLTYKAGNDVKLEIWLEDDLVGLFVYNPAKNLIYDLFLDSGIDYVEAIKSALRVLRTEYLANTSKVKFLGTQSMLEYFENLAINKIDYSHLFAWTSLSSRFDNNTNWYLTSLE